MPDGVELAETERLILKAFEAARMKGKPNWRHMTLSVLKNRLLQMSNHTFNELEYAYSFFAFIDLFPHLLRRDLESDIPAVVLAEDVLSVLLTTIVQPSPEPTLPVSEQLLDAAGAKKSEDLPETQPVLPTSPPMPAAPDQAESLDESLRHGDLLAFGEILATYLSGNDLDGRLARITAAWTAPTASQAIASTLSDLIAQVDDFDRSQLAKSVVAVFERLREQSIEPPSLFRDVAYRLANEITALFDVSIKGNPERICSGAASRLTTARSRLSGEVAAFTATNSATAKQVAIEVEKAAKAYRDLCIAREWPLLRELHTALGAGFRKFCEAYEQHDIPTTLRRASDMQQQIAALSQHAPTRSHSRLYQDVVRPVTGHVTELLEQALLSLEASTAPALALVDPVAKLDLAPSEVGKNVICRLSNRGQGRALSVTVDVITDCDVEMELLSPGQGFEIESQAERLITFSFRNRAELVPGSVRLRWTCNAQSKKRFSFDDELQLVQQANEPDWARLINSPPYSINPVRKREFLFGRDSVLTDLLLHANSQTSTFLWGSKRVGKTSLLQVVATELRQSAGVACLVLRMGEIGPMHEGEIAHTIATRLAASATGFAVPDVDEFGAGMRRLIPFVERLIDSTLTTRPLVIIDEFDDLDPAFYSGERGRQFVKALRSLSEVGLTFFFVGSERMEAIYGRHSADLNKWVNVHLDRIESRDDCRRLIARPVANAIEFDTAAVEFVVDYCDGNPFYMNVVCMELFKRCAQERRTYVGMSDVHAVRQQLLRSLGSSNFSHFWEDNPELDFAAREKQAAENALVIACVVQLGGTFETIDDVNEQQSTLGLRESDRLSKRELEVAVGRLKHRRVIRSSSEVSRRTMRLVPSIFVEWCSENTDTLVGVWARFLRVMAERAATATELPTTLIIDHNTFAIGEDDLIAVTQGLVYLGKQKDVAEVRSWLRQFDDESRIEIAFLLLRRLAQKGYISEGSQASTLTRIEEAINKRRTDVGDRVWRMFRQRRDNLCITFVDSETKSGAARARELAKRMRPGKNGALNEIGSWLKNKATDDPLLVIVDDFSGSGQTLAKGLRAMEKTLGTGTLAPFRDGRVLCYVEYAFPEALEAVRDEFPWIDILAIEVFGDELRALEAEAAIFESESELRFAREVLLQIGRELLPQSPFGFGDVGALVTFHNTIPNNTLPVFWCTGTVADRPWKALFQRA